MLFGISTNPDEAGAQLARLLSGELLGLVSGSVGLDTLRLDQGGGTDLFDDPTLVAGDVNPASRLTVGKRVGDRVELAYSQDLSQNGFVISTTYFAPAGISLRALLLDNEDRSYEFRHEPRIGVRRRPRPAPRPDATVAAVRFSGNLGFAESELRGQLRLTEGDRFDFAAWQQDSDRLRRYYQEHGFFEARVRARRPPGAGDQTDPAAKTVALEYAIEQGLPTRLEVSGYELPDEVQRRIVERWASSIFDRFLERDVDRIVRDYLFGEGRPQASVTATLAAAGGVRTLRVEIDPGVMAAARLQIDGNEMVPTERVLEAARIGGPAAAWLDPALVEAAIERLYQAEGLLSADVNVSAPDVRDGESVVRVAIQEGGPWQVGRVTLGGAEQLSSACRSRAGAGDSVRSPGDIGESRQARAAVPKRRLSGRSRRVGDGARSGDAPGRCPRAGRAGTADGARIGCRRRRRWRRREDRAGVEREPRACQSEPRRLARRGGVCTRPESIEAWRSSSSLFRTQVVSGFSRTRR